MIRTCIRKGPQFDVTETMSGRQWDTDLSRLRGAHPLQSSWWGEAKADTGVSPVRFAVSGDAGPVLMAQVFPHRIPMTPIKVGWIPWGPAWGDVDEDVCKAAFLALRRVARERGFRALVTQPYEANSAWPGWTVPCRRRGRTCLIDLRQPITVLEGRLHRHWRQGKNKFERSGGSVVLDTADNAVESLIEMYQALVDRKKFLPYGSAAFLRALWYRSRFAQESRVAAYLFRANFNGLTAAAALVLRAGDTAHFTWGASDY